MLVVIKPTYSCNLDCSYCYAGGVRRQAETAHGSPLGLDQLEALFVNLFRHLEQQEPSGRKVSFLWHGGEPMVLPIAYYQEAMRLQDKARTLTGSGITLVNRMQSNLLLLDAAWVEFLSAGHWQVGTSLDGPQDLHDLHRKTRGGGGSWQQVMASVARLKERQMAVGAVCVLTSAGLNRTRDLYDFFNGHGINFRINAVDSQASERPGTLGVTPQEYARTLTDLFDLWFYDPDARITVANLFEFASGLLGGGPRTCSHRPNCQEHVFSVSPEGELFPCGRFCGDQHFRFGSLHTDPLPTMLGSEQRRVLLERSTKTIPQCAACAIRDWCGGGCVHDALTAQGTVLSPSPWCATYRLVHSHLVKALAESGISEKAEHASTPAS